MVDNPSDIKVSLVGDFAGTIPPETLVVQNDADYVLAAQVIRDCAEQNKTARIWVRKKAHYNWLQAYVESVALQVAFAEKTPRLILADAWQVTIPDWLKDEQVLDQNLLTLQLPDQHPADFTSAMLEIFLGKPFIKDQISIEDIPNLLSVAFPEKQTLLGKYPVLGQCFEEKCLKWEEHSILSWTKAVCAFLQNEPESFWHDLSLWVLLSNYPEKLLGYVISPHQMALVQQLAPEKLAGIELHGVALDEASLQVKLFFDDVGKEIKTAEDVEKIISCCSGRFHDEFVRLMKILQNVSSLVQEQQLESIKQKFASCPGVTTADLIKLNTFIVPDSPAILSEGETWDANRWSEWTAQEYIPYRHWITENNSENNDLEETVAAFSDWYVDNYSAIHQEVDTSLVHVLTSWTDRIRSDELSLILVIDCLPLTYFHLLLKAFRISGFHKHEQGVRFAPLPSTTETCKSLLLSGDWHHEKKASYEAIVDQRVKVSWPEKKAFYLPNLQAMASSASSDEESAVYILNYIPSDEVMHSNPGLKGMTYDDELFNCFTKLAEAAHSFLQRSQKNNQDVSVYVVTDHGATRILDPERKSFESTIVQDLFENSKHRFATIDKSEPDSIPDNLWDIGYRFKQPFGDCNFTYFIPQGHKTAGVKKGAQGYVHGGATPEEIIVPIAVFKAVESEWKEPLGRFADIKLDSASQAVVFHIQRIVGIEIAIQNPNPEPLRIIRVEIVKPEASEVREFNPCTIEGNSEKQFDVKCYFKKEATRENELLLRFIYQYGEEEREFVLPLKSIFKTAVTGGFSLKNL